MEVITAHLNADFDAVASMVAAKRLYPEAELVFSGSQEKSVRDFFSSSIQYIYDFTRIKHIDLKKITRLIVVDTRLASRLGPIAACLDNPGLEIHLYDHHPDTADDLQGQVEVIEEVGSTTTIFAKIFQEKGIIPTVDEATLMALGIYEDTGFFVYSTTTGADLKAAAWLLEHDANLDIVNQFITHELTAFQIGLLDELIKSAATYTIQGVKIVVARMTLPGYVDNFAILIRRFMVMENLDVLFTLVCMGERIYLISRSRIPEVNVGKIAGDFGGGGHASAASATISEMTLIEAEEKLVHLLHRYVHPKAIAGEIMSSPVICAPPNVTMNEANQLLTRYNITVLPVVEFLPKASPETLQTYPSGVLGMISRRVVEKAIYHKLGKLPISDYMTTEIAELPSSATLADIQELIIENRQRLIPIVDDNLFKGVITRTDLLNILVNDPARLPKDLLYEHEHPSVDRTRNLTSTMLKKLERRIIRLLQTIGETAEKMQFSAYAAGGFVRDLLLGIKNHDLDIVIEGNGILFARTLAKKLGGTVRTHEKFQTATIVLVGGFRIDVATARLEYYEYPAAIPTVELSSLKLDLFRRDFTINAMAIGLNPEKFGVLVDFFNCQNDLKERRIRVLHNLSFVEDPTRIFRAIRFEQRLDFQITRHTEKLIKNAVRMNLFDRFFGPRFFGELKQIFSEENPIGAIRRLADLDLVRFLWPDLRPSLKIDRRFIHRLTQAHGAISWFRLLYLKEQCDFWIVYLLVIFSRSRIKELLAFCDRFELHLKLKKFLVQQKNAADRIAHDMLTRPRLKPSEIYWLLRELDNEGLLYLMAVARKKYIQKWVSQYVTHLRSVQPMITGKDLQQRGYRPGPDFKTMLNHLIEAQLDGKVTSQEEALAFIDRQYPLHFKNKHV